MAEKNTKNAEKNNTKPTLTVFGPETEFDGVLEFSGSLIITGDLEIAKNAVCTVEKISAKSVVISASVRGNIEASERVEICSGGSVIGDIVTSRIRIENNVNFEGQVTMLDKLPEEDLFSCASDEFKQSMVLRSDIIE